MIYHFNSTAGKQCFILELLSFWQIWSSDPIEISTEFKRKHQTKSAKRIAIQLYHMYIVKVYYKNTFSMNLSFNCNYTLFPLTVTVTFPYISSGSSPSLLYPGFAILGGAIDGGLILVIALPPPSCLGGGASNGVQCSLAIAARR